MSKPRIYSKDFKYTKVSDQGPNYLKRKFDQIRRDLKCNSTTSAKSLPDGKCMRLLKGSK